MSEQAGMVERVAQAICQKDEQNGGGPWDYYDEAGRERYRELARSAIEAIREPTELMLSAALKERIDIEANADKEWDFRTANSDFHVWQAMIDAALAEGEQG